MKLARLLSIVTLSIAAVILSGISAHAGRGSEPMMFQVTNNTTGNVEFPRVHLETADFIVFVSDGDVMGPGTETPGQREVYYWERATGSLTRVTTTPGGESYDAARPTDTLFANNRPQYIAFTSTGDFDPNVSNADGNPEIFFYDMENQVFHQITDTQPPVVNGVPFPSDSGKCVVFTSTGDLDNNDGSDSTNPVTGFTNPDGSQEVFLFSLQNFDIFPTEGDFTQLSNGPVGTTSHSPVIGGYYFPRQCQWTAFVSDHDQLGIGTVGSQLYKYDRDGVGTLDIFRDPKFPGDLIVPPVGTYANPMISAASNFARGPYVVFNSDVDIWSNDSTGMNLFRFRTFHSRMTQYTDLDVGLDLNPTVSDGGGFLAFQSTGDHVTKVKRKFVDQIGEGPFNADGNWEIVRTRGKRKAWQITDTVGCENTNPSLEDNGFSLTFRSDCDIIGTNPNNIPQVFYFNYLDKDDPLLAPGVCQVSQGCCSEGNGCYTQIPGKRKKVSRKFCAPKNNCK